jgi:glutathione S-transferase
MKLYISPTSPYARKVRIALREKNAVATEFDHSQGPVPSDLNPLSKVPTLVLDDGTVLFDSVVITEAIDELFPTPRLIPVSGSDRFAVRRWEAIADGWCDVLIQIVVAGLRPEGQRDSASVERLSAKVRTVIDYVDRHLSARTYAHGTEFSLADAALVSAAGYTALRRPDFIEKAQHLRAYVDGLCQRPSIASTVMPNLPVRG